MYQINVHEWLWRPKWMMNRTVYRTCRGSEAELHILNKGGIITDKTVLKINTIRWTVWNNGLRPNRKHIILTEVIDLSQLDRIHKKKQGDCVDKYASVLCDSNVKNYKQPFPLLTSAHTQTNKHYFRTHIIIYNM